MARARLITGRADNSLVAIGKRSDGYQTNMSKALWAFFV
ncbi:Uncharacterised protein [Leminorella grimontii]|nr:Uncharacterised protein [Leminorella grimontii]